MYSTAPYPYAQDRAMYYNQAPQGYYAEAQHIDNDTSTTTMTTTTTTTTTTKTTTTKKMRTAAITTTKRTTAHDRTEPNPTTPAAATKAVPAPTQATPPTHNPHPPTRQHNGIPYSHPSQQQQCQQHYPTHRPSPSLSSPSSSQQPTENKPTWYCLYSPCAARNLGFTRKADLERHVETTHNHNITDRFDCEVAGCHRKGSQGFVRKDKKTEHMRDVHGCDIPRRQGGGRRR